MELLQADEDLCDSDCKITCLGWGYDAEKEGGVGDIDTECQQYCGEPGIAKWDYDGGFSLEDEAAGFDTDVNGDDEDASWTSDPDASCVLSKEGNCYQILPGGPLGEISNIEFGISHVTLCGDGGSEPYCGDGILDTNEECDDGNNADNDGCSANCTREGNEVPEFGTIAALGILGASAGIIYSRRRK